MFKRFLILLALQGVLGGSSVAFGENCRLILEASFKVNQISDGLILLDKINELDFLSEKVDLNEDIIRLAEASKEVKAALIPEVVKRYLSSENKELKYGISKKRVYQQILASLHNPYEIYQENSAQNTRQFLDDFLLTRGADYKSKDILPIIEALQEKIKIAKAGGLSVDRVVLTGSLTNGLLRKGSDLDFIVDPSIPMTKKNPFEGDHWYSSLEDKVKSQNSKLGIIDFAHSGILHPSALGFISEGTKLMIEVKEGEVFLLLYPPMNRQRIPAEAVYERVPIHF